MNRIILVFGLSGSGKSTLIRYLTDQIHRVTLLKKYSTRDIREYEKHKISLLDNCLVTEREFSLLNIDSSHTKYGISYGVSFKDIDTLLSEGKYPIFASPSSIFKKVNQHYKGLTIKILVKCTVAECQRRIYEQEMSEEQRGLRIQYWKDYQKNEKKLNFDIIINNHGTYNEYLEEIDKRLMKYFKIDSSPNRVG